MTWCLSVVSVGRRSRPDAVTRAVGDGNGTGVSSFRYVVRWTLGSSGSLADRRLITHECPQQGEGQQYARHEVLQPQAAQEEEPPLPPISESVGVGKGRYVPKRTASGYGGEAEPAVIKVARLRRGGGATAAAAAAAVEKADGPGGGRTRGEGRSSYRGPSRTAQSSSTSTTTWGARGMEVDPAAPSSSRGKRTSSTTRTSLVT